MPASRTALKFAPFLLSGLLLALLPAAGLAQGAPIAFGGLKADTSAPVEVAADTLSVDQSSGQAVFTGHVEIAQGEMRLSAEKVTVDYAGDDRRRIRALLAEGDVLLVSGPDAAQAARASYDVENGIVTLHGEVLVSQGQNVLTGQEMTVDLATGTAQVAGRVRTILQPSGQGD